MHTDTSDLTLITPKSLQDAGVADLLSVSDVRKMVKIVGEVAAMHGEIQVRRRAMMQALCELVEADTWMWTVSTGFRQGDNPMTLGFITEGLSDSELSALLEYANHTDPGPIENPPMLKALEPWSHVTTRRSDLLPDEAYYKSPQFEKFIKKIGIDHYIFSLYPLEHGVLSGIGLHRRLGKPDFTPRQKLITHIIVNEVDWLHRTDLPDHVGVEAPKLSPRRREVFAYLLMGWSRKRIASELGLTPNTVAGYQKDIYKLFGVTSQSELIVQFLQGDSPSPGIDSADQATQVQVKKLPKTV